MDQKYNSQQKKLVLPEYGRNVQQMVDYCVEIPDREERTRCAYTIVQIMGNLFPQLRDTYPRGAAHHKCRYNNFG